MNYSELSNKQLIELKDEIENEIDKRIGKLKTDLITLKYTFGRFNNTLQAHWYYLELESNNIVIRDREDDETVGYIPTAWLDLEFNDLAYAVDAEYKKRARDQLRENIEKQERERKAELKQLKVLQEKYKNVIESNT